MKYIIVSDDRLWKSIARDTYSFVTLLSMVGIGWLIDSAALQWIGGMMWILFTLARVSKAATDRRMTISEAREYLDKLESSQ